MNNFDRSLKTVTEPPYSDKVDHVVEYKTTPGDGIEKVPGSRDIYKSEGDVKLKSSDKIYKINWSWLNLAEGCQIHPIWVRWTSDSQVVSDRQMERNI